MASSTGALMPTCAVNVSIYGALGVSCIALLYILECSIYFIHNLRSGTVNGTGCHRCHGPDKCVGQYYVLGLASLA